MFFVLTEMFHVHLSNETEPLISLKTKFEIFEIFLGITEGREYSYINMIRGFKFKILVPFIAFVFILPIVTAFCCCTDFDPNQSRQEMLGHNHESHDHGSHHHGNGQEDKTTTPESCECGNEILANVVNRTTIDFSAINTHFSKLQNDPIFQLHVGSALQATQNAISFHATGPPGSSSATPLYLQISVLRI